MIGEIQPLGEREPLGSGLSILLEQVRDREGRAFARLVAVKAEDYRPTA